jgi:hypothetical protein
VKKLGSTERKNKNVLTPTGLRMEGVDGAQTVTAFHFAFQPTYTQDMN